MARSNPSEQWKNRGSGNLGFEATLWAATEQAPPAPDFTVQNLAVRGLEGDLYHGGNINSYYDGPHDASGRFDCVLINPPFNINSVAKEKLKDSIGSGRRFPFGLLRTCSAHCRNDSDPIK